MKSVAREKRLIEDLQTDLRALSNETKRRYPPVKEAAESAVMKLRTLLPTGATFNPSNVVPILQGSCGDFMQPFIMGCDTRCVQVIHLCLSAIQRMITHEIIDESLASNVISMLWQLFEQNNDELQLRLLQTVLIVITTKASHLHGVALSRAIVLCFRLHFTKNEVTNNTAEASVRQAVSVVFDKVIDEDEKKCLTDWHEEEYMPRSGVNKFSLPPNLSPALADAYLLFQDLCQLVNADSPQWLVGITEMTRTFGLELLESVLTDYESIFKKHPEFKFLLKDRVCALVIRLFSPNIKHRQGAPPPPSGVSSFPGKDKPYFPISMRLLRVVSVLLKKYYHSLVTESEIFLSLLIKFLDTDKPNWQRALAIEVICQLCSHSRLLKSFCLAYDMQPHSTKIFHNLVSSLSMFVQNLFLQAQANSSVANNTSDFSLSSGSQILASQQSFEYHGVLVSLVPLMLDNSNCIKYTYLDMLDKAEPTSVTDSYLLTMAYNSVLNLVKGLTAVIDTDLAEKGGDSNHIYLPEENEGVLVSMVNYSWCSLLSVLSLLLDASTDETCNESILKCIESFAGICGQLKLNSARDAFVIVLCKASLPLHYMIPVLTSSMPHLPQRIYCGTQDEDQQHVVVVGNSYPQSVSTSSSSSSVALTTKNVQCMRTILNLAHCYGAHINTAWQLILTTLQHLVWILGLRPDSSGQLKTISRTTSDSASVSNTVLTTAVLGDLPILSNMLSRLFEASQNLDDVALHHLINALCSLSVEAMDTAYNSNIKEPSLFAVAKLLETGLVNMNRIEILWRPVTGHLLEVCQHPNSLLREWGAEGVTSLVKAALKYHKGEKLNIRMLNLFLSPLKDTSAIVHLDVRQKQLETVLQILQFFGDSLNSGWPDILEIIGSATDNSTETIVRLGFRSVQLIISDYILSLPVSSISKCIHVVSQYAKQTHDFNISLTAIGLLWSLSDFICHNQEKLSPELQNLKKEGFFSEYPCVPGADALWMILFCKMGLLCMDSRPAVRKSAGQTLFSTLSAHWSTISKTTWHEVVWSVLFQLMDDVQRACSLAPSERNESNQKNILMHHSRDTEEKQWQETSVLTLAGIARVFKTKTAILVKMDDFENAWQKILEYIFSASTNLSVEISRAALCSFEEILNPSEANDGYIILPQIWKKSWLNWCAIGQKITIPPPPGQLAPEEMLSQAYLTSFVQLFPVLHEHLYESFCTNDFKTLAKILYGTICIPVRSDSTAFILPTGGEILTPLQEAIVNAVNLVQKSVSPRSDDMLYPAVFEFLLSIVDLASNPPSYGDIKSYTGPPCKDKWICVNYINFSEYCINAVVDLFQLTASHKAVVQNDILLSVVKGFHVPIKKKYNSKAMSTWQLAINGLIKVLQAGLPVVRQHSKVSLFDNLWDELAICIEDFLFPTSVAPSDLSVSEHQQHESYDLLLIELIRNEILPYHSSFPKPFLTKLIGLLNKGSICVTAPDFVKKVGEDRGRDEFNKQCFSTLLQFSMLSTVNGNTTTVDEQLAEINEITVTNLLQRCRSALTQYITRDRLKTRFPYPEAQLNEVLFALKALDTLLQNMKSSSNSIDDTLWHYIFDLYPVLVECIPTSSSEIRASVAQVLTHFKSYFLKNCLKQ